MEISYTYELDDRIVIQQCGSIYVNQATGSEILHFSELGWVWEDTIRIPEQNKVYVIMTKSISEVEREYLKVKANIPHGWLFHQTT